MGNSGPNTNTSQFFFTLAAAPHLDGENVVFGKVVEGLEVIQAIGGVKTSASDRPEDDVTLKRIKIVRAD